jgi:hypothetical protein
MIRNLILLMTACLWLYSCKEDNFNTPKGSTEAPQQVTVSGVRDISGASVIYFSHPNDKHLKYVKAVWTTDDDITYDATASFYTDSMLVDGFGAEGAYKVKLYSVSDGGTYSEPVEVDVNPTRPPYLVAFDKMEILPNFLGIRVVSENETGAKLTFRTFKKDTVMNEYVETGTDYLLSPNIEYMNRGHAADTLQYFGVQIRDRWGHWSPMKEASIIPWFEMELPKNIFAEVALCNLSGDGASVPDQTDQVLPSNFWGHKQHTWSGSNTSFASMWDGTKLGSASVCHHTKPLAPLPQHFTFDLGAQYMLSRMVLWPRNDNANLFRGGHPQIVRVYAATYNGAFPEELVDDINDPNAWLDLGIFYFSRADGSFEPYPGTGDRTAEDNALLEAGHEMILKATDQKVRYLRVQTVKCFAANTNAGAVMISELSVFGSDK